jgi:hypothetical protein
MTTANNSKHSTHHNLDVAHASMDNPFLMMMEPKTVVKAMHCSSSLRGLKHKTYRPLDKPWINVTVKAAQARQTAQAPVHH